MKRNRHLHGVRAHMHSHKRSGVSTTYFRELIYGAIDGIITTFAVVAGFSGAALSTDTTSQLSFAVVLLFGIANLFADGVSMGLGSFLAVRSEQGMYRTLRHREEGFSEADAHTLVEIFKRNEAYWVDFILSNELKIQDPMNENPYGTALATFGAFVSFGFIPLMPFMVMDTIDPQTVFQTSATGAFIALIILGILKWKVAGTDALKSIIEVVLVGSLAAFVAYGVGTLFAL
jgi:vacuolar iron transporter family protein